RGTQSFPRTRRRPEAPRDEFIISPRENLRLLTAQVRRMTAAVALDTPTQEEVLHWLALRMTPGLGTRTAVELIRRFKTPERIFRSSTSELEAAGVAGGMA